MTPAFKKHVGKICDYLRFKFFLHEYTWDIEWAPKLEHEKVAASMRTDPTYLNFTISIGPTVFEHYKAGRAWALAQTLVHEFAHTTTEPLYMIALDAITNASKEHLEQTRERQTQRICNIVMNYLPKRVYRIERPRKSRSRKCRG